MKYCFDTSLIDWNPSSLCPHTLLTTSWCIMLHVPSCFILPLFLQTVLSWQYESESSLMSWMCPLVLNHSLLVSVVHEHYPSALVPLTRTPWRRCNPHQNPTGQAQLRARAKSESVKQWTKEPQSGFLCFLSIRPPLRLGGTPNPSKTATLDGLFEVPQLVVASECVSELLSVAVS